MIPVWGRGRGEIIDAMLKIRAPTYFPTATVLGTEAGSHEEGSFLQLDILLLGGLIRNDLDIDIKVNIMNLNDSVDPWLFTLRTQGVKLHVRLISMTSTTINRITFTRTVAFRSDHSNELFNVEPRGLKHCHCREDEPVVWCHSTQT